MLIDNRITAIESWGTRGLSQEWTDIKFNNLTTIDFFTAWTPPLEWLRKTAKLWPDLEFYIVWYEIGMGEYGSLKIKHNDYQYEKSYQMRENDLEYTFNKTTEDLETLKATGRFTKVIAKAGNF